MAVVKRRGRHDRSSQLHEHPSSVPILLAGSRLTPTERRGWHSEGQSPSKDTLVQTRPAEQPSHRPKNVHSLGETRCWTTSLNPGLRQSRPSSFWPVFKLQRRSTRHPPTRNAPELAFQGAGAVPVPPPEGRPAATGCPVRTLRPPARHVCPATARLAELLYSAAPGRFTSPASDNYW